MKAAIYVAHFPGAGFDEELAAAQAFCAAHGLMQTRLYHSDFLQDKRLVAAFMGEARRGFFEVLVVRTPESFPTRMLKQLVTAGVGLACYGAGR